MRKTRIIYMELFIIEKIKKIYSKSDNSGVSLIYELTLENNKKDTIKLYLPKPKK